MNARNSVTWISKNERNSCSETDSVLIVPSRTNISAGTVIKVRLSAKYVDTLQSTKYVDTLQSSMIRQSQRTKSLQLLQPALKYAKKDQSIRVLDCLVEGVKSTRSLKRDLNIWGIG